MEELEHTPPTEIATSVAEYDDYNYDYDYGWSWTFWRVFDDLYVTVDGQATVGILLLSLLPMELVTYPRFRGLFSNWRTLLLVVFIPAVVSAVLVASLQGFLAVLNIGSNWFRKAIHARFIWDDPEWQVWDV